jgi:outer membrane protein
MRVLTSAFLILAVFALVAAPAMADEMVSLKVGYLTLSPEGEFAVSNGTMGTRVDMEDDLGFDDSEDFMVEAAVQLGSFRLTAGYLPLGFSGSGNVDVTTPIDFGGETFSGSVNSDVDIDLYDVGLTWYLLNFDDLPVRLQVGPELSVKYVDADITMKSSVGSESESVSAPVPTIGLRGRVGLSDFLGLVGRVGYLEYDDNSFLDADVQLEFSPLPLVGLFAGYRYFDLEVDEEDVFLDVTFDGPYGGAFIRF